jgi:4-hydroxybenzoate polyprenyltransferase
MPSWPARLKALNAYPDFFHMTFVSHAVSRRLGLYLDLIRWNRPAGWLLLLWPSLSALWIAAKGFPGWHLTSVFVLGTILMRSAGCCVNDVADKDFDRHVKRTANRPVTRGALRSGEALAVGAVLALLAFALVLTTNWATVAWSFAALAIAIAYPFAKRFFAMPQAVLGVAFSFGIPMAFAAVTAGPAGEVFKVMPLTVLNGLTLWNAVPNLAWLLLLGNLFWVLAYDTEYAMVDRDDDLAIGIKTSAITLGQWDVPLIMTFYAIWISLWCWLLADRVQSTIGTLTLLVMAAQVVWHYRLIRHRQRETCFQAFKQNHWLGFTAFVGIALGLYS